jgi:hypothetical protein
LKSNSGGEICWRQAGVLLLFICFLVNFILVRFTFVYAWEYKAGAMTRGIDLEDTRESSPVALSENIIINDKSVHQVRIPLNSARRSGAFRPAIPVIAAGLGAKRRWSFSLSLAFH